MRIKLFYQAKFFSSAPRFFVKRLIQIPLFFLAFTLLTTASFGQNKGFQAGGGLFVSTDEALDFGFDARGSYQFDKNWRASAILSIFFPQKDEASIGGVFSTTTLTTKYSAFAVSLEGNYLFPNSSKITPYVLAGLNIVSASAKVEASNNVLPGFSESSGSDSGASFNLGAGVDFAWNQWTPLVEFKYSFGEADYAVFIAGIKYRF